MNLYRIDLGEFTAREYALNSPTRICDVSLVQSRNRSLPPPLFSSALAATELGELRIGFSATSGLISEPASSLLLANNLSGVEPIAGMDLVVGVNSIRLCGPLGEGAAILIWDLVGWEILFCTDWTTTWGPTVKLHPWTSGNHLLVNLDYCLLYYRYSRRDC